ncbi:nucleoside deaminase [Micromonospora terminaliae]|uniref:tRNA-specific adenosine deaminase n=2 Tax=Micromonosporaceae TaxID=28056 RepID=A0AAJ2ZL62_9ACTN|nr:nucleoside deaminase [Micromonospora terminaliae]NES31826.1 nucleoside deaminase [Micromonospora terminaliae]QGL49911.1 nucleoside deaminase [Micromonospora terminaliae]
MRSEPPGPVWTGGAEPADATDPALETVRPGQPTPGRPARVGPGADEGLAEPDGVGRRQRHELWMRRALEVAVTGPDGVPGDGEDAVEDVPVGAVVYGPDGAELAIGRNERELTGDPTAHAEVLALRRAAERLGRWRLEGCTLVVSLEPCTMCAGAIALARISTVVFGAWEPKTGAVGSLWDVLRDRRLTHRPEVYGGVREAESAALLRAFFR